MSYLDVLINPSLVNVIVVVAGGDVFVVSACRVLETAKPFLERE